MFARNPLEQGVLYHKGFCLNPMEYVHALAELAGQAGASIYTGTEVKTWEKCSNTHILHTSGGSIRAKQVVIAGNAYTPKRFHKDFDNRTLPVLTSVLVTTPTPDTSPDEAGIHTRQGIMDTRKLKYYYRKLPDGRILFGGRGAIRGADADNPYLRNAYCRRFIACFPAIRA